MSTRRSVLGRGLGALIPNDPMPETSGTSGTPGPQTLPVDRIDTTTQPRTQFDPARLKELAESIRNNGILQPILVRSTARGRYSIIAGERRFRAAGLAGLSEVPVVIRDATTAEAYELALVENIQREDLDPIEEALAYRHLVETYRLTQAQIAQRVGKERTTVANALRLLKLPESVQAEVTGGALSAGHARAILSAPEAQRITLAQQAVDDGWSVRETERRAKAHRNPAPKVAKPETAPALEAKPAARSAHQGVEAQLSAALGLPVRLINRAGKGRLEIRFQSTEELEQLIEGVRRLGG